MIALDHLGVLPQLSLLFSRVLIPKAVREDLFKRRATKDRLQLLLKTYAFLERCDEYDRGAVIFLLAERTREGMKDRGEVEAVVQASQVGATVIWMIYGAGNWQRAPTWITTGHFGCSNASMNLDSSPRPAFAANC